MTEDEAKTKWCPKYQVSQGTLEVYPLNNRMHANGEYEICGCIASKCMWWTTEYRVFLLDENRFMRDDETVDSERPMEMRIYPEGEGHCGAIK